MHLSRLSANNSPMERRPSLRNVAERNALVTANLGLVGMVVRNTNAGQIARLGGADDAFQVGIFGLIRAAELWDPRRAKFSTYATSAIKSHIYRASNCAGVIALPSRGRTRREEPEHLRELIERAAAVQTIGESFDIPREDPERLSLDEIAEIWEEVAELPSSERTVMLSRLDGATLLESGAKLGVTKERARQIQANAVKRLRKRLAKFR